MEHSIELVKKEIREINPRYCIVITNDSWWEPFRKKLQTKQLTLPKSTDSVIESVETFENTKIIVTTRPFAGSSNIHVEEILKYLK
jgi:hypothetical protein